MKTVTQLDVNLSRLGEVRPAERVGTVQQESPVGQIHSLQRDPPVFAKAFAQRNVERRMGRQMIRAVASEEARAIANIS